MVKKIGMMMMMEVLIRTNRKRESGNWFRYYGITVELYHRKLQIIRTTLEDTFVKITKQLNRKCSCRWKASSWALFSRPPHSPSQFIFVITNAVAWQTTSNKQYEQKKSHANKAAKQRLHTSSFQCNASPSIDLRWQFQTHSTHEKEWIFHI